MDCTKYRCESVVHTLRSLLMSKPTVTAPRIHIAANADTRNVLNIIQRDSVLDECYRIAKTDNRLAHRSH